MLPLTLITGIFGMNVNFPGEGSRTAYWAILLLLVALVGGMVGFFRLRRWI